MALNLANIFTQADAHVEVYFIVDGKKYRVDHFRVGFAQGVDYKGQPQHEMKGGQFSITLAQIPDDNLYLWAKSSTLRKDATIIFWSEMIGTVLELNFINASCVRMNRNIDALTGTSTSLIISPNTVSTNGITHTNHWK